MEAVRSNCRNTPSGPVKARLADVRSLPKGTSAAKPSDPPRTLTSVTQVVWTMLNRKLKLTPAIVFLPNGKLTLALHCLGTDKTYPRNRFRVAVYSQPSEDCSQAGNR